MYVVCCVYNVYVWLFASFVCSYVAKHLSIVSHMYIVFACILMNLDQSYDIALFYIAYLQYSYMYKIYLR